jgi:hypothetical protein
MARGQGGGPKTAEGKARSSRNAVKHGVRSPHPFIIEGVESPEEWEEFKLGIIESWQPVGMQELELAINVAFGHWRLRRCRLNENALLSKQVYETEYELQQADADDDEDYDEDDGGGEDDLPEPVPLPVIDPETLGPQSAPQADSRCLVDGSSAPLRGLRAKGAQPGHA